MHHLIDLRKIQFLQRLNSCNNCAMIDLYCNVMLHSAEFISLFNLYKSINQLINQSGLIVRFIIKKKAPGTPQKLELAKPCHPHN